ncbi:MAG TPA: MATE family efflux transporter [Polyangiaceae bacterium]|nr:MATE family efflux transporter [Polyangiaceae bacterium]
MSKPAPVLEKGLWSLTWPLLWSLLLSLSLSFVDAFFLSRVSDRAAAAVGALLPVIGMTIMVFSPLAQAGASVAGQLTGAGRHDRVPGTYLALVIMNASFGLCASAFFLLAAGFVPRWLGLEPEMAHDATTYLRIVGGFIFLRAVQIGFTNILNSRGETRWTLAEAAFTNVLHVVLNAAFLYGWFGIPRWGVAGIATSTVISLTCGMTFTICVVRFKLGVRLPWSLSWPEIRELLRPILRIGLPSALEPISFQCMQLVLNLIVIGLGAKVLAARVYAFNFFMVTTILWAVAFGIGTQISIAHRMGASLHEDADRVLRRALSITITGNVALCGVLAVVHPLLLAQLTTDASVIEAAHPIFLLAPLVEAGRATNIVAGGALRACGDSRFTAVVGTSLMWGFGVPMAYFLSTSLGLGLAGIWLAMGLDEGARGCMNFLRWRHGRWRQLGVVRGHAPIGEPSPSV